jgi:hypothetical protein
MDVPVHRGLTLSFLGRRSLWVRLVRARQIKMLETTEEAVVFKSESQRR